VIAEAAVTITNSQTGAARRASTGVTGAYARSTLPPGLYTVTIKAPGFRAVTVERVSVTSDKTVCQSQDELGVSVSLVGGTLELRNLLRGEAPSHTARRPGRRLPTMRNISGQGIRKPDIVCYSC
jgi:hypothetical protein